MLASAAKVLDDPRSGNNGAILLHLEFVNGERDWISVAPRLPIALSSSEGGEVVSQEGRAAYPADLQPGTRLLTGDEVLIEPDVTQGDWVALLLTGGWEGHGVKVPCFIPLAILTDNDLVPDELRNLAAEWREETGFKAP